MRFSRLSMTAGLVVAGLLLAPAVSAQAPLQITEFIVTPTAAESIEIFNPTSETVDLTDYYLTDATFAGGSTFYWQLTTGGGGGGGFGDFFARFPAGATIAPGEYQTMACGAGAVGFFGETGVNPTYELNDSDAGVPDMLEATPGSIGTGGGLTNSGEFAALIYWDGVSDLVTDIDYLVYGDKVEAVDKTGVTVGASTYADDTAIVDQDSMSAGQPHGSGESAQRQTASEGTETSTGGNGADGHDETSENLSFTWAGGAYTPNAATASLNTMIITESGGNGGGGTSYDMAISGADAADFFYLFAGTSAATQLIGQCPGESLGTTPLVAFSFLADGSGEVNLTGDINVAAGFGDLFFQAFNVTQCEGTNVVRLNF